MLHSIANRVAFIHQGRSPPREQSPPPQSQEDESNVDDVTANDILELEEMQRDIAKRREFLTRKRKALEELRHLKTEEKKFQEQWKVGDVVCHALDCHETLLCPGLPSLCPRLPSLYMYIGCTYIHKTT